MISDFKARLFVGALFGISIGSALSSGAANAAGINGLLGESLSGSSGSGFEGTMSAMGNGKSAVATGIGSAGTQSTFSPTQFTSVSSSTGQFSVGTIGAGSAAQQSFENFGQSQGSASINGQFQLGTGF